MARVRQIREMGEWYRALTGTVRRATARALIKTASNAATKAKRNARDRFRGTADRPKTGNLVNAIFAGFIASGFGKDRRIGTAVVAVASQKGNSGTRPYGRVQEYGGVIKPVKAKNLWQPLFGPKSTGDLGRFRDITPREFMAGIMAQRKRARAFMRRGKDPGASKFTYKGRAKRKSGGSKPVTKSMLGQFVFLPDASGDRPPVAGFDKVSGRGKTTRHKFIALFALRKSVTITGQRYVNDAVDEEFIKLKANLATEMGVDT